jgi:hypothetical protein
MALLTLFFKELEKNSFVAPILGVFYDTPEKNETLQKIHFNYLIRFCD